MNQRWSLEEDGKMLGDYPSAYYAAVAFEKKSRTLAPGVVLRLFREDDVMAMREGTSANAAIVEMEKEG